MFTYEELLRKAADACETEVEANRAEHEVYDAKIALAQCRDQLDREISLTFLQATNDGKLDGKNAEARKAQLDVILLTDDGVARLRAAVAAAETVLGLAEQKAADLRAKARLVRMDSMPLDGKWARLGPFPSRGALDKLANSIQRHSYRHWLAEGAAISLRRRLIDGDWYLFARKVTRGEPSDDATFAIK